MNKLTMASIALAVPIPTGTSSQTKTRVDVSQKLIEAQQSDPKYVTDTSYLEVNPIVAARVTRMKYMHYRLNTSFVPNDLWMKTDSTSHLIAQPIRARVVMDDVLMETTGLRTGRARTYFTVIVAFIYG